MTKPPIPAGTRAAMIQAVVDERFPKLALPAIASRFSVTYEELRAVVDKAGYPDNDRMRSTAAVLLEQQSALEAQGSTAAWADPEHDVEGDMREDLRQAMAAMEAGTQVPPTAAEAAQLVGLELGEAESGRLTVVRVADLQVDPSNMRRLPSVDDERIVELADSIAESGLLQPIVARRHAGRLVVVMGHRRLVAMRRLRYSTVDCIVRGPMSEEEVLAAMLIENGQREDLNPIDEARGLARLQEVLGCTEAALGRRIGRSGVFVAARLDLLKLSNVDQERVRAGDLAIGAAVSAVRSSLGTRQGTPGVDRNWHLGPRHPLAELVRARCERAQHPKGRRLGGVACGECWEAELVGQYVDAIDRIRRLHPRGDEEPGPLASGLWCPGCGEERTDQGDGGCRTRRALAGDLAEAGR